MARVPGRAPLTRDQIVQQAVALMDREGVEAASMRRLATELQVMPMALYYYFKDRHALLGAVADAILAECEIPVVGDWQERLRALCWSYRRIAQRHPNIFLMAMTYGENTPGDYVIAEAFLAILAEAGLPPHLVVRAYNLLITYVAGFAADEVTGSLLTFAEVERETEAILERQFPQLYQHRHYLTEADMDSEFTYGLSVIITSLPDTF